MNCKKIQNLLPLYIEKDLPKKKASKIRSHLKECPLCQKESEKYKHSLKKTKNWIQSKNLEWDEKEWRNVLERAFSHKKTKNKIFAPLSFKPSWAVGLMLIMAIVFSIFVTNPFFIKKEKPDALASPLKSGHPQEKIELILISNQTGLKVKWIFNKEFNLEEEIK